MSVELAAGILLLVVPVAFNAAFLELGGDLEAAGGGIDPDQRDPASWLGIVGIPIGAALLVGTLEFVGPNERDGWTV